MELTKWKYSEGRNTYIGDIAEAANYFAGILARRNYGTKKGTVRICRQDSHGPGGALYQATIGTVEGDLFVGDNVWFTVSEVK